MRPAVRTCRDCGCTDARACEGGCWWVEADLCSTCKAISTMGHKPGVVGATILTRAGHYFDVTRPELSVIEPADIAAGLSKVCRFGGQCREFYSVAQHSLLVASLVPPEDEFAALMHDASEAYIGDIPAPIKQLLPDYQQMEARVERAIADRFALRLPRPASVKHADMRALVIEREDLMTPTPGQPWPAMAAYERAPATITPWSPRSAEGVWLAAFERLNPSKFEDGEI